MPLYGAAVVPFKNNFLVIGGKIKDAGLYSSARYSSKVYKYNWPEGTWTEMPELQLSERKYGVTAMIVSSSLFD